jgi:uncharacterized protein HemX
MNNEKILVIFKEVCELKDKLESAIESANQLSDLNADSKNVTAIIDRFTNLEELTEKKIEEINNASKAFSMKGYMSVLTALIISIVVGLGIGYFIAQKAFITHIQNDILRAETNAIANAQIALEKEKLSMQNYAKAKELGVEFYNNAIMMPTATKNIQEKNGKAVYLYKKNDYIN